jgi:hypothetical protein
LYATLERARAGRGSRRIGSSALGSAKVGCLLLLDSVEPRFGQ